MPAAVGTLRARLASTAIVPLLSQAGFAGCVHSVYRHAVNLVASGRLITVAVPAVGAMPNGLVLADDEPLDRLGLVPGMAIEGDGRALHVRQVGVSIDFSDAYVWSPVLTPPVEPLRSNVVTGNLRLALHLAAGQAPEHGLGPLLGWLASRQGAGILTGTQISFAEGHTRSGEVEALRGGMRQEVLPIFPPRSAGVSTFRSPRYGQRHQDEVPVSDITGLSLLCRVALPLIQAVAGALQLRDGERALTNAASLVGLGPGLTPSGDDFLAGLCAALFAANDLIATPFAAGCADAARGKTTLVAETLMFHAARGEFSGRLHSLLRALLSDGADGLSGRVQETLAWGSSSGADCLLGAVVGLSIMRSSSSGRRGGRAPAVSLREVMVI